ncbi:MULTISPECIES: aminotransferase class I/II-fold pyridoxal phosphate-dependent enzyme [Cyanophyceae]|uniref:DegT/DnrJ/EryC1/StrS family aminotransferase n=1 Tax=Leptolyngbya subtilissima DQ-A4 TaxID=2933933 RepID=A0ABV0K2N3_9CYAN|nr:aminotransferase class I/II-fold pyridoxal phosphate-dependent enzyme [Nodosilinea sp. FACHB-141]MBD2112935.1 DegT/DnrJ/EryC1/StrS family aminotransferase [Nodosilinea sp. FACHB-141]
MSVIPPVDLTEQFRAIQSDVNAAVAEVLASGQYINGPVVETFTQAFGDYVGTKHCIGCNSGTDALYLALRALNIGPGDEVITSPFTFIATAEAISAVGATPVFVDIDLDTFNIDVAKIEAAVSDRTRAIMPVHLFGRPVDMGPIMDLAARYDLTMIEDCAQATGAEWMGQQVGRIGQVGCFSFFPTKNLGGCGDGGALTTNDDNLAATARMLSEHGSRVKYHHEAIGVNSRLDSVQAAILAIKLRHLDRWNQQRSQVADRYYHLLASVTEVVRPLPVTFGRSVWNQYTLRLPQATAEGQERNQVQQLMREAGVICMVYYPLPLHLQPVYRSLGYQPGDLPQAEAAAQQVLSLPMFPELGEAAQDQVVQTLKSVLAEVGLKAAQYC